MATIGHKPTALIALKTSVDALFSAITPKRVDPSISVGELMKSVGFCQHEFLPSDVRELLKLCFKTELKYTESQLTLIENGSAPASQFTLSLNGHLNELDDLLLVDFAELILLFHGLKEEKKESDKNANSNSGSTATSSKRNSTTTPAALTTSRRGGNSTTQGNNSANKTATALRGSFARNTRSSASNSNGKTFNTNSSTTANDVASNKPPTATFEGLFLPTKFVKTDIKAIIACTELLSETVKELRKVSKPPARDQDLMYRGLQLTLHDTQKTLKKASESISNQQATIDTTRRLSEDLDKKWDDFNDKFQQVNEALVRRIARTMGAKLPAKIPNLVAPAGVGNNTNSLEDVTAPDGNKKYDNSNSTSLNTSSSSNSRSTNSSTIVEPKADKKRPDEKCAVITNVKKHAQKSLSAIGDHPSFIRHLGDVRNAAAKSAAKRSARGSGSNNNSARGNNNSQRGSVNSLGSARKTNGGISNELSAFDCIDADDSNKNNIISSKLPHISTKKTGSKTNFTNGNESDGSSTTTSSESSKLKHKGKNNSLTAASQAYLSHPKVQAADLYDKKMRYAVSAKIERDFPALPKAVSGDWLSEHSEVGQSVETFIKRCNGMFAKPSTVTNTLYIQPLGTVDPKKAKTLPAGVKNVELLTEKNSQFLKLLKSYLEAFFGDAMKVKILPFEKVDAANRHHDYDGRYQIHAGDIINKALPALRLKHRDAYAFIGVTMEDLYPRDSWNFVFGLADMMGRNGVFSFARYDDDDEDYYLSSVIRGGDANNAQEKQLRLQDRDPLRFARLLKRACKVMTHELCHCFGVKHCVHFNCLMQGSNNSEEAEKKLHDLCPCCLKKILYATEFDPVNRYKRLQDWCEDRIEDGKADASMRKSRDFNCYEHIFGEWSAWYGRRIEAICEKIIESEQ